MAELASAGRQIIVLVVVGLDTRSMPLGAGQIPEGGEVVFVVILLGGVGDPIAPRAVAGTLWAPAV